MAAAQSPLTLPAAPGFVSLEEYLNTEYRPDRDYVDGYLEERRPPEERAYTPEEMETLFVGEKEHNKLQALIASWFIVLEDEWHVDTVTEQRIYVTPERVRICDVCILRGDAPYEKVIVTPPLLCVEILSPQQRLSRARVVLEDYRDMGVAHIWLIDPLKRTAFIYASDGLHETSIERLEIPGTPIHLPLGRLLDKIERMSR